MDAYGILKAAFTRACSAFASKDTALRAFRRLGTAPHRDNLRDGCTSGTTCNPLLSVTSDGNNNQAVVADTECCWHLEEQPATRTSCTPIHWY
ncbi:hypothetical protein Vi05172_g4381 [Venturia inaequalis]|nr:hypothetical protein Vi05172_g4381 [Venturia inaequalis]